MTTANKAQGKTESFFGEICQLTHCQFAGDHEFE